MTVLWDVLYLIGVFLACALIAALALPPLAVTLIWIQSRCDDLYGAYVKWWMEQ